MFQYHLRQNLPVHQLDLRLNQLMRYQYFAQYYYLLLLERQMNLQLHQLSCLCRLNQSHRFLQLAQHQ